MFDFGIGSGELLVIAIVALIVIGPKDLPRVLRAMGHYMRKIQGLAREFQNHLNEAAKEAGVEDVKKEVKGMTNFTVTADLDKQGSEIKRAIEASAPKPAPAPGANGSRTESAPDNKAEPAKIESANQAPTARPEPATPKPAPKPKSKPRQKADPGREAVKS